MNKRYSWSLVLIVLACFVSFFIFKSINIADEPTVDTMEALAEETRVTLNAAISDPEGQKVKEAGFRWGNTESNLDQKESVPGSIESEEQYSITIEGLEEGHTYYYQAYAVNSKGTGFGKILSFTTLANTAPSVSIKSPENNASVVQGKIVTVNAAANDDREVKIVELFINDSSQSRIEGSTLNYSWDTENTPPGKYELKISASDGSLTTDRIITVTIEEKPLDKPVTVASSTPGSSSGGTSVSRAGESADQSKYPLLSKLNGSYGQFPYRNTSGGRIEISPQWIAANIVTITLPGLNQKVQVHKNAADNFITAFNYIKNGSATINGKQVSLLSLIKTMDGTFVPRHVNWDPSRGLSNHSWGTAIDINAANHFRYVNPSSEPNDPNYILWQKAFKPAGFSWGNSYGDAMHFELLD